MNILEDFTQAVAHGVSDLGYRTQSGRLYDTYMENSAWKRFLSAMSEEHLAQYEAGGGKELEEKDGRPPKMASCISSSRFVYASSFDIEGFSFEKKLATAVGGVANLDGYAERADKTIYVEAKLREPYSHKPVQRIKQNYKPLYDHLRKMMPGVFDCVMEDIENEREMRTVFFCRDETVCGFDIKQMICHMLGIANDKLAHGFDGKEICFLYLLYNPVCLEFPSESGAEIRRIYMDTCRAAQQFELEAMFGHIVDFLIQSKNMKHDEADVAALKKAFKFKLCDQDTYRNYYD